jgi:hypothetical protein
MEWTSEVPTGDGLYAFYGWTSDFMFNWKDDSKGPRLTVVKTSTIRGGKTMYVGDGAFVYPREMRGMWKPIVVGELPNVTREQYE